MLPRHAFACALALLALLGLALASRPSEAIPAFARRYHVGCRRCHDPFPRLNEHGELFAARGFREADGETPFDTTFVPDPLLSIGRELPLSIRMDGNVQVLHSREENTRADFQTPWNLKILSSAPLTSGLSYYFYFFFYEQGEVSGVEDAYVTWNRVGGTPLDLTFGQFQVSDPLFARELRLPLEDYTAYRAHVGGLTSDLTYDRGVRATWDRGPLALAAEVVNGNGKVEAEETQVSDDDATKNVAGRVSLQLHPALRVGAFGYGGRQDGANGAGPRVRASLAWGGLDATLALGALELNAQWLHRRDRLPTFTPGEPDAATDGGFVEALWVPEGSRTYGYALWNRVDCDRALLDPRAGGPEDVSRFQTFAAGAGRLVQRNVRVQGELAWDSERERFRATASTVFAY